MNFVQRVKNLWYLSGLEASTNSIREVQLEVPREQEIKGRRLATIVQTETKHPMQQELN